jgi:hypothetical protein
MVSLESWRHIFFATEQFFNVWLYNLNLNPVSFSLKGLDPDTDTINMNPKVETHEKSMFFVPTGNRFNH